MSWLPNHTEPPAPSGGFFWGSLFDCWLAIENKKTLLPFWTVCRDLEWLALQDSRYLRNKWSALRSCINRSSPASKQNITIKFAKIIISNFYYINQVPWLRFFLRTMRGSLNCAKVIWHVDCSTRFRKTLHLYRHGDIDFDGNPVSHHAHSGGRPSRH